MKEFSRRQFLKGAGSVAALAAVHAVGVGCGDGPSKSLEAPTDPYLALLQRYQSEEVMVNNILTNLDQGMADLDSKLRSAIPDSDTQKGLIISPLDVYANNKNNKDRNLPEYYKKDLEKRGKSALQQPTVILLDKPEYFFIGPLIDNPGFAAGYNSAGRYLLISEKFNPKSVFDQVVAYHELTHVQQDNQVRERINTEQGINTWLSFNTPGSGEKKRIIAEFEYEAYLKETLVMNMLSGGSFRKAVENGTVDQFTQTQEITPEQKGGFNALVNIARTAFRTNAQIGNYPKAYTDQINMLYRTLGYDLYRFTADNHIQLIP